MERQSIPPWLRRMEHADVTLDRMERALENAEFQSNRRFLSWAAPNLRKSAGLAATYAEPVFIEHFDLPQAFADLAESARSAIYALEEPLEVLATIADTDDPLIAFDAAERIDNDYRSGGYLGYLVSFELQYDEDCHDAWLRYAKLRRALESGGVLDEYQARWKQFKRHVESILLRERFAKDAALKVQVQGNLRCLPKAGIEVSLVSYAEASNASAPRLASGAQHLWHFGNEAVWRKGKPSLPITECREELMAAAQNVFAVIMGQLFALEPVDDSDTAEP